MFSYFMQIVFLGDNVHGMLNLFYLREKKKIKQIKKQKKKNKKIKK